MSKSIFHIEKVSGRYQLSELREGEVDVIGTFKTERGAYDRKRRETLKRDYPDIFGYRAKDVRRRLNHG